MASRFFAFVALLLIVAGAAGYLVAAGLIPWTYPAALLAVCLVLWGFFVLRRSRHPRGAPNPRGGRPGLELWDEAGRTTGTDEGRR